MDRVEKKVSIEEVNWDWASERVDGDGVEAQEGEFERMPVAVAAESRRVEIRVSVVLRSAMRSAGVKVLGDVSGLLIEWEDSAMAEGGHGGRSVCSRHRASTLTREPKSRAERDLEAQSERCI